jgi:hypothetical protein
MAEMTVMGWTPDGSTFYETTVEATDYLDALTQAKVEWDGLGYTIGRAQVEFEPNPAEDIDKGYFGWIPFDWWTFP